MTPDAHFQSGAVRSAAVAGLSFTSLPWVGVFALARTGGEGAAKYGRYNYMLGMPVHDLLDHVIAHIGDYILGDRSEPHLAHAAWGLLAAIQSEVLDPALSDPHMLGPGATVTPAMRKDIEANRARLAERRKTTDFSWNMDDLAQVKLIKRVKQATCKPRLAPYSDGETLSFGKRPFKFCNDCPGNLGCELLGDCVESDSPLANG